MIQLSRPIAVGSREGALPYSTRNGRTCFVVGIPISGNHNRGTLPRDPPEILPLSRRFPDRHLFADAATDP